VLANHDSISYKSGSKHYAYTSACSLSPQTALLRFPRFSATFNASASKLNYLENTLLSRTSSSLPRPPAAPPPLFPSPRRFLSFGLAFALTSFHFCLSARQLKMQTFAELPRSCKAAELGTCRLRTGIQKRFGTKNIFFSLIKDIKIIV